MGLDLAVDGREQNLLALFISPFLTFWCADSLAM